MLLPNPWTEEAAVEEEMNETTSTNVLDRAEANLAAMRDALKVCAETWNTVDEWLGQASTHQAAMDALHRMRRALQRAGVDVNDSIRDNISWRGSLLAAMDRAGIGLAKDNEIRLRLVADPPWDHASGPLLLDHLHGLRRFATHTTRCALERGGICDCGRAALDCTPALRAPVDGGRLGNDTTPHTPNEAP